MRWPAFIGRYEVRGRLAMGGTSEVLLGAHTREDGAVDEVAIKRPIAEQALDPEATGRIRAEGKLLAHVCHEHVVRFLELIDGETPALVMERLRGRTLDAALQAGARVSWPLAVEIAAQAAAALEALHAAVDEVGPLGAVHRDVSPENLFLVEDGGVRLCDFNVASYRGREMTSGALQGRIAYMAPEQARGEIVEGRADVFALGAVLWELVVGERLFWRGTTLATLRALVDEPAPRAAARRPELPSALDALVTEALDRDPARRPDAAALHRRLRALSASPPRAELVRLAT